MRFIICVLLGLLALQAFAIPFKQQIALLNSLQTGKNEDPMTWNCNGCDAATKDRRFLGVDVFILLRLKRRTP